MESKLKHLEMIQAIISRMASNMMFLRGWTITIISGLFALGLIRMLSNDPNGINSTLAFLYFFYMEIVLLLIWSLDGYFLWQERLFRCLYEDVARRDNSNIDFSMDTRIYKTNTQNSWWTSTISKTLLWFYAPLTILPLILFLFIFNHA